MLYFDLKKRHIKGEKHITQMDFAEYLLGQKKKCNSAVSSFLKH